jgi:hypothetical protein
MSDKRLDDFLTVASGLDRDGQTSRADAVRYLVERCRRAEGHADTQASRDEINAALLPIPRFLPRQDATVDQLRDLHWIANRFGLYDAADIVKGLLK